MEILRIEEGFVVIGGEVDGRGSPHDLGFSGMVTKAGDFTDAAGLTRRALIASGRLQLVRLE